MRLQSLILAGCRCMAERADRGDLDEAIALNSAVPQGLSLSIFTLEMGEAKRFMAADGSDCGIANVNIRTSGADIGGAIESCRSVAGQESYVLLVRVGSARALEDLLQQIRTAANRRTRSAIFCRLSTTDGRIGVS